VLEDFDGREPASYDSNYHEEENGVLSEKVLSMKLQNVIDVYHHHKSS